MSETEIALLDMKALVPAEVFAPGGIDALIEKVEAQAREHAKSLDATTPNGRKDIKSLAYRVARSKTALEAMGDDLKAGAKKVVDGVNLDLRAVRTRLDSLRDEVRAPADEYDAREEARTDAHKAAIIEMERLAIFDFDPDEAQILERENHLESLYLSRDFQEFRERSRTAWDNAGRALRAYADSAKARRIEREHQEALAAQQAEEARVAAEAARAAREAEIARLAAENARIEAQQSAERERLIAAQKARAEQDRLEVERLTAVAAAQQAERDRIAAIERAEIEKQAAVEAERRRVADVEAARVAEDQRRAANREHRVTINREIVEALGNVGLAENVARAVVTAIATGAVPNVAINY